MNLLTSIRSFVSSPNPKEDVLFTRVPDTPPTTNNTNVQIKSQQQTPPVVARCDENGTKADKLLRPNSSAAALSRRRVVSTHLSRPETSPPRNPPNETPKYQSPRESCLRHSSGYGTMLDTHRRDSSVSSGGTAMPSLGTRVMNATVTSPRGTGVLFDLTVYPHDDNNIYSREQQAEASTSGHTTVGAHQLCDTKPIIASDMVKTATTVPCSTSSAVSPLEHQGAIAESPMSSDSEQDTYSRPTGNTTEVESSQFQKVHESEDTSKQEFQNSFPIKTNNVSLVHETSVQPPEPSDLPLDGLSASGPSTLPSMCQTKADLHQPADLTLPPADLIAPPDSTTGIAESCESPESVSFPILEDHSIVNTSDKLEDTLKNEVAIETESSTSNSTDVLQQTSTAEKPNSGENCVSACSVQTDTDNNATECNIEESSGTLSSCRVRNITDTPDVEVQADQPVQDSLCIAPIGSTQESHDTAHDIAVEPEPQFSGTPTIVALNLMSDMQMASFSEGGALASQNVEIQVSDSSVSPHETENPIVVESTGVVADVDHIPVESSSSTSTEGIDNETLQLKTSVDGCRDDEELQGTPKSHQTKLVLPPVEAGETRKSDSLPPETPDKTTIRLRSTETVLETENEGQGVMCPPIVVPSYEQISDVHRDIDIYSPALPVGTDVATPTLFIQNPRRPRSADWAKQEHQKSLQASSRRVWKSQRATPVSNPDRLFVTAGCSNYRTHGGGDVSKHPVEVGRAIDQHMTELSTVSQDTILDVHMAFGNDFDYQSVISEASNSSCKNVFHTPQPAEYRPSTREGSPKSKEQSQLHNGASVSAAGREDALSPEFVRRRQEDALVDDFPVQWNADKGVSECVPGYPKHTTVQEISESDPQEDKASTSQPPSDNRRAENSIVQAQIKSDDELGELLEPPKNPPSNKLQPDCVAEKRKFNLGVSHASQTPNRKAEQKELTPTCAGNLENAEVMSIPTSTRTIAQTPGEATIIIAQSSSPTETLATISSAPTAELLGIAAPTSPSAELANIGASAQTPAEASVVGAPIDTPTEESETVVSAPTPSEAPVNTSADAPTIEESGQTPTEVKVNAEPTATPAEAPTIEESGQTEATAIPVLTATPEVPTTGVVAQISAQPLVIAAPTSTPAEVPAIFLSAPTPAQGPAIATPSSALVDSPKSVAPALTSQKVPAISVSAPSSAAVPTEVPGIPSSSEKLEYKSTYPSGVSSLDRHAPPLLVNRAVAPKFANPSQVVDKCVNFMSYLVDPRGPRREGTLERLSPRQKVASIDIASITRELSISSSRLVSDRHPMKNTVVVSSSRQQSESRNLDTSTEKPKTTDFTGKADSGPSEPPIQEKPKEQSVKACSVLGPVKPFEDSEEKLGRVIKKSDDAAVLEKAKGNKKNKYRLAAARGKLKRKDEKPTTTVEPTDTISPPEQQVEDRAAEKHAPETPHSPKKPDLSEKLEIPSSTLLLSGLNDSALQDESSSSHTVSSGILSLVEAHQKGINTVTAPPMTPKRPCETSPRIALVDPRSVTPPANDAAYMVKAKPIITSQMVAQVETPASRLVQSETQTTARLAPEIREISTCMSPQPEYLCRSTTMSPAGMLASTVPTTEEQNTFDYPETKGSLDEKSAADNMEKQMGESGSVYDTAVQSNLNLQSQETSATSKTPMLTPESSSERLQRIRDEPTSPRVVVQNHLKLHTRETGDVDLQIKPNQVFHEVPSPELGKQEPSPTVGEPTANAMEVPPVSGSRRQSAAAKPVHSDTIKEVQECQQKLRVATAGMEAFLQDFLNELEADRRPAQTKEDRESPSTASGKVKKDKMDPSESSSVSQWRAESKMVDEKRRSTTSKSGEPHQTQILEGPRSEQVTVPRKGVVKCEEKAPLDMDMNSSYKGPTSRGKPNVGERHPHVSEVTQPKPRLPNAQQNMSEDFPMEEVLKVDFRLYPGKSGVLVYWKVDYNKLFYMQENNLYNWPWDLGTPDRPNKLKCKIHIQNLDNGCVTSFKKSEKSLFLKDAKVNTNYRVECTVYATIEPDSDLRIGRVVSEFRLTPDEIVDVSQKSYFELDYYTLSWPAFAKMQALKSDAKPVAEPAPLKSELQNLLNNKNRMDALGVSCRNDPFTTLPKNLQSQILSLTPPVDCKRGDTRVPCTSTKSNESPAVQSHLSRKGEGKTSAVVSNIPVSPQKRTNTQRVTPQGRVDSESKPTAGTKVPVMGLRKSVSSSVGSAQQQTSNPKHDSFESLLKSTHKSPVARKIPTRDPLEKSVRLQKADEYETRLKIAGHGTRPSSSKVPGTAAGPSSLEPSGSRNSKHIPKFPSAVDRSSCFELSIMVNPKLKPLVIKFGTDALTYPEVVNEFMKIHKLKHIIKHPLLFKMDRIRDTVSKMDNEYENETHHGKFQRLVAAMPALRTPIDLADLVLEA